MEEIWKPIEGFEGYYEVSSLGNVKSVDRIIPSVDGRNYNRKERIKVLSKSQFGYLKVNLYKYGELYGKSVHRLVAEAFIPNPKDKPEVNHKNGIKTDNKVDNLEWCTSKENINHAINLGLSKIPENWGKGKHHHRSKLIGQFSISGKLIKKYYGGNEASRQTGICQTSISMACRKELKTAGGFIWKFL
jgi:hypothetical protein